MFKNSRVLFPLIILGVVILAVAILVFVITSVDYRSREQVGASNFNKHLKFRSCGLYEKPRRNIQCFFYKTDLNEGFELPLALIFSNKQSTASKPIYSKDLIVVLSGGPGQGFMTAADELSAWTAKLEREAINADILLYDVRGTGDGKGRIECELYNTAVHALLQIDIPLTEEVDQLNSVLKECVVEINQQLNSLGLDLDLKQNSVFSTESNVKDLAGIIDALDYQNVHLWGVSYGTRVALAASNLEKVKTLLLDSPYPITKGGDLDMLTNVVNTLALHKRAYMNRNENLDNDQSYESIFRSALKKLENKAQSVHVETWKEGRALDFQLNQHRLIELSIHILYTPYLLEHYYSGLEAFTKESRINESFQLVIEHFVSTILDPSFNTMVYFATECSDNKRGSGEELNNLSEQHPLFADYILSFIGKSPCRYFTDNSQWLIDAPINREKPTIALTGELDPVTPKIWAEGITKEFKKLRLVDVPGAGHAPLSSSVCSWGFINDFVERQESDIAVMCDSQH